MTDQTVEAPRGRRIRIDPRFRQRRIQVKREEGRRRLRVLVGIVAALMIVVVAFGAAHSPLLVVRHVRVAGAVHTSVSQVIDAAGLSGNRHMIDINGAAAARAVERLPWIAKATVGRRWPATIAVVVTERAATAIIGPGPPMLIDRTGRVLGPPPTGADPQSLPLVMTDSGVPSPPPGPPGSLVDAVYGPALMVAAALPPALEPRVTGIVVAADGSVGLHLGRASARLGSPTDALVEKLTAVQTLLDKVSVGTAIIDVTVASAPVLLGG